jgi:hypothetical protein
MTKIDRLYAPAETASSSRLIARPLDEMPFNRGYAARRQRASVVIFTFGLLLAVFAASMILRIVSGCRSSILSLLAAFNHGENCHEEKG